MKSIIILTCVISLLAMLSTSEQVGVRISKEQAQLMLIQPFGSYPNIVVGPDGSISRPYMRFADNPLRGDVVISLESDVMMRLWEGRESKEELQVFHDELARVAEPAERTKLELPGDASRQYRGCVVINSWSGGVQAKCSIPPTSSGISSGIFHFPTQPEWKWPSAVAKELGTRFYYQQLDKCQSVLSAAEVDTCLLGKVRAQPTCD